jgi:4-amino-4-deoxy-L-arabinose transferase-like glycosyltransferase
MARWQRSPGCLPGGSQLLPVGVVPGRLAAVRGQLAVVLLAWAALALLGFLWLSLDKRPLAWDQAHHFLLSLRYLDALQSPLTWPDIFSVAIKYPYLFHLGLAKVFWFTGVSLRYAAAVNLFWLLVLMIALWLLGRRVFGGWAGVWAAILCAAAPASVGLDRQVLLEPCLAATIAWTVLALHESRGLSRRGWVIALGALLGWGLLAKWTFPLYVAAPVLLVWLQARRPQSAPVDKRGLWWALFICLAMALPWYLHSPVTLFKILFGDAWAYGASHGHPPVLSLAGLAAYPLLIINDQLFLPLAALSCAGLVWTLIYRRKDAALILAWFLGGLLLITLMRNKDTRFLYPLLPALVLCLGGWLNSLKPWWLRIGAVGLSLLLAVGALAGTGFGKGPLAMERKLALGPLILTLSAPENRYLRPHDANDWSVPEIVRYIAGSGTVQKPATLGVLASLPEFHKSAFLAQAKAGGLPVQTVSVLEPSRWQAGQETAGFWRDVGGVDFILLKTGNLGKEPLHYKARDMIAAGDPERRYELKLVREWDLPDGSRAKLLAVKPIKQ